MATVAAFILATLTGSGVGVELLLKVTEGLIREALLLAQCLCQPFHRFLAFTLPRLALGHPHILHHLLKLAQRLLSLSHAALLHELLNTVHHVLQVLLGELHAFALLSLFAILLLLLLLLGELLHVFVCRVAQLLHQLCDFFL